MLLPCSVVGTQHPEEKWRGTLGGLEEQKSPLTPVRRPRPTLRVRSVPGGFAVFAAKSSRVSEIMKTRAEALAEAERLEVLLGRERGD